MSDDASYTAFLNRANEPLSAGKESTSTSAAKGHFDPTSQPNDSTPQPIKTLLSDKQPHYTSETDSPFTPFFATYSSSSLPDIQGFAKLLKCDKAQVEALSVEEWDPKGQYREIVEAVKRAGVGDGGVKVYRVEGRGARVEYYVLTMGDHEKLVGVRVESVES